MKCKNYVYLNPDETEFVFYEDLFGINHGFGYQLGNVLFDLSSVNEELISSTFLKSFYELSDSDNVGADFSKHLVNEMFELDTLFPAVHFYSLSFLCLVRKAIEENKILKNIESNVLDTMWIEEDKLFEIKNLSKAELFEYTTNVLDNMWKSIDLTRKEIIQELKRIQSLGDNSEYNALTPTQRLYYLDNIEGYNPERKYTGTTFFVCLKPQILDALKMPNKDPKLFAKTISDAKLDLIEAYEINNTSELVRFEFIKIVLLDKQLKTCQNCGGFFIPRGRPDIKYCDRIPEGETQTCAEIGAARAFKEKVVKNPAYKAYQTAYKRMSSRVIYGYFTRQYFLDWAKEARKMRDACINGELTLKKFEEWLNDSK